MNADAVLFDADHTLYMPHAEDAYREMFAYLADATIADADRLRTVWEDVVDEIQDSPHPADRRREHAIRETLKQLEIAADDETVTAARDVFWDQVVADLVYDPAVRDVIEALQEAGLQVGVVTDEFREPLERKLREVLDTDPAAVFDTMVTPEDTSVMKPSPVYYRVALRRLGSTPEQTVMVGDSWERDLQPAAAEDLQTVLVAARKTGDPDEYINDITDLPALVLG